MISFMNINAKLLRKLSGERIQQLIEGVMYHDEVEFIPGMKNYELC